MRKTAKVQVTPSDVRPQEPAKKVLIADDSWVTVSVIDVSLGATRNGEPRMLWTLSIDSPRAYEGRTLYFSYQPSLTMTIEWLVARLGIPAGALFNEDDLWARVKAERYRAHVSIAPATSEYPAANRVMSLWKVR